MRSSLKEALERQERDRNGGAGHHPSGIPVELVLQISASNDQPVDLVKALMAFGLDLHEAHDIVDRLAIGEKVATTLYLTAESESPFALSRFGVRVGAPAGRRGFHPCGCAERDRGVAPVRAGASHPG